jgi:hypothetical protein
MAAKNVWLRSRLLPDVNATARDEAHQLCLSPRLRLLENRLQVGPLGVLANFEFIRDRLHLSAAAIHAARTGLI